MLSSNSGAICWIRGQLNIPILFIVVRINTTSTIRTFIRINTTSTIRTFIWNILIVCSKFNILTIELQKVIWVFSLDFCKMDCTMQEDVSNIDRFLVDTSWANQMKKRCWCNTYIYHLFYTLLIAEKKN